MFLRPTQEDCTCNNSIVVNNPVNLTVVDFVSINSKEMDMTTYYTIWFKFRDGDDMEWIYTNETDRDTDLNKIKSLGFDQFDSTGMTGSLHENVVINGETVQKNLPINLNNCKFIYKVKSNIGMLYIDADFGIKFMFLGNYNTIQTHVTESDMLDDQNALTFM